MIAGKAWPQPLAEGAHLMTMSTYKSLGGPAGRAHRDQRCRARPAARRDRLSGLTANFDAAKSAALAVTLLDWKVHGRPTRGRWSPRRAALAKQLAEGLAGPRTAEASRHRTSSRSSRTLGRRTGRRENAAPRQHPLMRHRAADRAGRRRHQRAPARHARDRALGHDRARAGTRRAHRPRPAGNEPEGRVAADVTAFRQRFNKLHVISGSPAMPTTSPGSDAP